VPEKKEDEENRPNPIPDLGALRSLYCLRGRSAEIGHPEGAEARVSDILDGDHYDDPQRRFFSSELFRCPGRKENQMARKAVAQRNQADAGLIPLCGRFSLAGIYFEHLFPAHLSFQGIGTSEVGDCFSFVGGDYCHLLPGFFRIFGTAISPRPAAAHFLVV
jgi:hypothetical protein